MGWWGVSCLVGQCLELIDAAGGANTFRTMSLSVPVFLCFSLCFFPNSYRYMAHDWYNMYLQSSIVDVYVRTGNKIRGGFHGRSKNLTCSLC